MSFAKQPAQAPQWDATSLAKFLKLTDAQTKQLVSWKRYMESTLEYDGAGLRDVVAANAYGLDALKSDHDAFHTLASNKIADLELRVKVLEEQPQVPFPGSSLPTA